MNTTNLFVELIVIGLGATVWLGHHVELRKASLAEDRYVVEIKTVNG